MLWTLVMVSLLVSAIAATGGGRLRQAAALGRNAGLDAVAEGGVQEAVFHLLDGGRDHWGADGAVHRVRDAGGLVALRIDSETGKINPNRASLELLAALLQAVGADGRQALAIANAMVLWRTPSGPNTATGGGRDFLPPGAPFESLAEIGLVQGMTPALLARVAPFLTLYHDDDPDPLSAGPVVREAMQAATGQGPGAAVAVDPAGLPQHRDESLVAVTAIAADGDGHRVVRRAIVLTGGGDTDDHRPFRIMEWGVPQGPY